MAGTRKLDRALDWTQPRVPKTNELGNGPNGATPGEATEQRSQGEGIRPRLVQLAQSEEDTDPEDVEQSEAPAYNIRERNKKKLRRVEP
ncbi:hypothetical protein QTP86_017283, partial [Hemibagrus guttatus]